MTTPRSNFVTVVAWIFIVLSGFGTAISVLQNMLLFLVMPMDEFDRAFRELPPELPGIYVFLFQNIRALFVVVLLVASATLAASIGLLRRREWARKLFVGLMLLGALSQAAGLVMQAYVAIFLQTQMQLLPQPPRAGRVRAGRQPRCRRRHSRLRRAVRLDRLEADAAGGAAGVRRVRSLSRLHRRDRRTSGPSPARTGEPLEMGKRIARLAGTLALATPASVLAHEAERVVRQGPALGLTGLWLLANAAYAGMRAQDSPSHNARAIAFLFGLPLSLLTLVVVGQGSERAYGVDLPRKRSDPQPGDESRGDAS